MSLYALNAISPIDGRYQSKTKELNCYYSEAALIKYRVRVEVEYFISLCKLPLKKPLINKKGIKETKYVLKKEPIQFGL